MTDVPLVPEVTKPLPRLGEPEGLLAWVASADHKLVAIMYLVGSLFFFVVGGLEALVMRVQLAVPRSSLISPEAYNQMFTMHGTTMIFLVVVPLLVGFMTYLTPLMIGARDLAFPRLNALSFWVFLFGGLLLYFSFVSGGAPNAGWFSYAPLSEKPFATNLGLDYWAVGLLVVGIGTVGTGINLITTVWKLRAPGMTIRRLPLFVWMSVVNSVLIVLALPVLNASLVMLLADRQLYAHYFRPQAGGDAVLWQHYFWSFGHPEVYIMVLPAFGVISEVIPVFSRKPIFGYAFVAGSTVAIAFLSFAVWAHHMFAVGLGHPWDLVFGATSMLIAVPTGVKIFNWIATMWGGRIRFTTAMLFAMSFLIMFTIGGISGVMFAVVPIDWQLTDTYFVVAHMHYVLFGGTLFALFAGAYYWFPKITGRMLSERLGKWHFWLTFAGFNLTFFVQHFLGLMGMPRRVSTYPDLPGWGLLNLVSTVGVVILAISVLVFMWNVQVSLRNGQVAGDNPWNAWTLEWATTSPPPVHNFDLVPPVRSRRPLWDLKHPDKPDWRGSVAADPVQSAALVRRPSIPWLANIEINSLGMLLFLLNEAVFFGLLIFAFIRFRDQAVAGPGPNASNSLDIGTTSIYTACLLASSLTVWLADRSLERGSRSAFRAWLVATIALGGIFLVGQGIEYSRLLSNNVKPSSNLFGTTFFTMTGFHGFHVFVGLVMLTILAGFAFAGHYRRGRSAALGAISLYWHFVDIVWVVIFSLVYVWTFVGTRG